MQPIPNAPQVITEFKRRRKRQWLALIPIFIVLILMASFANAGPDGLFGIPVSTMGTLYILVIAGVVLFTFSNWRCPSCKGYLGRAINPMFCQKCGAQLHD